MVGAHDLRDRAVDAEVLEHVGAELGVLVDRLPVVLGQRALALHHAIGQREAADVVQQAGRVREVRLALADPALSAMSRANAATAALWRAVRPSRRSSDRTSADSTPHDSAAYWPARWRAMTTRRDM